VFRKEGSIEIPRGGAIPVARRWEGRGDAQADLM